jgi:hypothetical protein
MERKSPPGPREMVQEHRVINSYSPPAFTSEVTAMSDELLEACGLCDGGGCTWCDDTGLVDHDCPSVLDSGRGK